MRILTGPGAPQGLFYTDREADDLRFFANDGRPFHELLAELPAGWVPDGVVVWFVEYYQLPAGIETCPYPLVFIVGDWNLGLTRIADVLTMADHLVTDSQGVEALRRRGFTNVSAWRAFSFDPAVHHPRPAVPLAYDVSFIGNFNHAIHARRARLLARLAQLSDRYRIGLLTGVYGEDYARVLSGSRLIFNLSVRGELNMRAYEGPAAGRPLLIEADNVEAPEVLPPGTACVTYTDDTLVATVEALLADPDRCERIAAEGHARIQAETKQHHWAYLERLLGSLAWSPPGARRWWQQEPHVRLRALARQAYLATSPNALTAAVGLIERAVGLAPRDPRSRHAAIAIAAVLQEYGPHSPAEKTSLLTLVLQNCEALLRDEPRYALAWLGYGNLLQRAGRPADAARAWQQALDTLPDASPFAFTDLLIPSVYDHLRVGWERAAAGQDETLGKRLLEASAALALGLHLLPTDPAAASAMLARATTADPEHPDAWHALGDARLALADPGGCLAAWQQSIALLPFTMGLRRQIAGLLILLDRTPEAAAWIADSQRLIQAAPSLASWAAGFTALGTLLGPRQVHWVLRPDWLQTDWAGPVLGFAEATGPDEPVVLHVVAAPQDGWDEQAVYDRITAELAAAGLSEAHLPEIRIVGPGEPLPASALDLPPATEPRDWAAWFRQVAGARDES